MENRADQRRGCQKKDLEKARRLFSSAAEHGIVDAQIGLARMLLDGVGGPQDYNKALQLLDHAVKQGSIEAQCSSASSSFLIESQRLIDKCKVDADAADAASEALLAEEEAIAGSPHMTNTRLSNKRLTPNYTMKAITESTKK